MCFKIRYVLRSRTAIDEAHHSPVHAQYTVYCGVCVKFILKNGDGQIQITNVCVVKQLRKGFVSYLCGQVILQFRIILIYYV